MSHVLDIKLKRTDTKHDLSQKAEKQYITCMEFNILNEKSLLLIQLMEYWLSYAFQSIGLKAKCYFFTITRKLNSRSTTACMQKQYVICNCASQVSRAYSSFELGQKHKGSNYSLKVY